MMALVYRRDCLSLATLGLIQSSGPIVETAETASHPPASVAGGLSAFLCRPFLCWRRLSHQLLVGETLAGNAVHYSVESVGVVGFTGIIPVGFFVQIPKQVEWFHANIGALDCPFEQAPEVFDTVGMDTAPHVFLGMVNDFVGIIGNQPEVCAVGIGVDNGAWINVPTNLWRQSRYAECLLLPWP